MIPNSRPMSDLLADGRHRAAAPETDLVDLRHQLELALAALTAAAPPEPDQLAEPGSSEAVTSDARPGLVDLEEMPKLISVSTAAKVLGISRASAYRYAACGDLPTIRLGGRLYVVSARLKAFLEVA